MHLTIATILHTLFFSSHFPIFLFSLAFLCQLVLLYLITRWWSSGLWPTCFFCFCSSLPHSLSPGKHVQSHEDQVSISTADFLLTSRPTVIRMSTWLSHTIFTFVPGSLPYYSEHAIQTKTKTSELFWTLPLLTPHSLTHAPSSSLPISFHSSS